ncbi:MAG: hypothetical protein U0169_20355 [Polyangiaceae bacterium]
MAPFADGAGRDDRRLVVLRVARGRLRAVLTDDDARHVGSFGA